MGMIAAFVGCQQGWQDDELAAVVLNMAKPRFGARMGELSKVRYGK